MIYKALLFVIIIGLVSKIVDDEKDIDCDDCIEILGDFQDDLLVDVKKENIIRGVIQLFGREMGIDDLDEVIDRFKGSEVIEICEEIGRC